MVCAAGAAESLPAGKREPNAAPTAQEPTGGAAVLVLLLDEVTAMAFRARWNSVASWTHSGVKVFRLFPGLVHPWPHCADHRQQAILTVNALR